MSLINSARVNATNWINNREVHILSNYHDPNQMSSVQRKDKSGKKITIDSPTVTIDYSANMKAVDKL